MTDSETLALFESADVALKAIILPFGVDAGLTADERSDILTALCIIGQHRNWIFFRIEKERTK